MTNVLSQQQAAEAFRRLHRPGRPLVLVNVWDLGSALTVAAAGAQALATSSWSVAKAQGLDDGEHTPFEKIVELTAPVADRCAVPISVDLEKGYGATPEDVGHRVEQIIQAGAIGFNLEDSQDPTHGAGLRDADEQADRVRHARLAADHTGVPAFLNARTDLFLQDRAAGRAELRQVLARAEAYGRAGADGLFVPGLQDPILLAELTQSCSLPVNVMADSGSDLAGFAAAGVARISFGASPYVAAMSSLTHLVQGHGHLRAGERSTAGLTRS